MIKVESAWVRPSLGTANESVILPCYQPCGGCDSRQTVAGNLEDRRVHVVVPVQTLSRSGALPVAPKLIRLLAQPLFAFLGCNEHIGTVAIGLFLWSPAGLRQDIEKEVFTKTQFPPALRADFP
jgi:hypothetical protein